MDAAVEPGGLDRLMAGDTPTAALVAGHLAGCPDCAEELERLRRSVGIIGPAIRSVPSPDLRERTLAYVAAVGRPRDRDDRLGAMTPSASRPPATSLSPSRIARLPLVAGLAAAIVLAATGAAFVASGSRDAVIRGQADEIEALGEVAVWTLRVDAQPDVQRFGLASATGAATSGTLVFSPTTKELVVVADKLPPAPAGHEYRCWIEVGGKRAAIGKMFFGGDLAYWVGHVPQVAAVGPGARFGVSLVDLAEPDQAGSPVLVSAG
jgi:hypothetical protein